MKENQPEQVQTSMFREGHQDGVYSMDTSEAPVVPKVDQRPTKDPLYDNVLENGFLPGDAAFSPDINLTPAENTAKRPRPVQIVAARKRKQRNV